jgi:hypothetical protein
MILNVLSVALAVISFKVDNTIDEQARNHGTGKIGPVSIVLAFRRRAACG